MSPDNTNRSKILLTAQAALVGEIFPLLRKVEISWGSDFVILTYHVDGELSDDDRDSITSIEAEMVADLPDFEISSEIILPYAPHEESDGFCIFSRRPQEHEPTPDSVSHSSPVQVDGELSTVEPCGAGSGHR